MIIASVNTWAPVMYNMMDAEFFISSLFFIVGVIVINFWLLNLFVAVITNTFSMIREETKKSAFGANAWVRIVYPSIHHTEKSRSEQGRPNIR